MLISLKFKKDFSLIRQKTLSLVVVSTVIKYSTIDNYWEEHFIKFKYDTIFINQWLCLGVALCLHSVG